MTNLPLLADAAAVPETGGLTMGVEEEFLLVDPDTGRGLPCAAEVLARARELPAALEGVVMHPELRLTQLEVTTGVCTTGAGLREHLVAGRRALGAAAAAEGVAFLASGTPVLASHPSPGSTSKPRFGRIDDLYQAVTGDYEASGCHVHVGVPDRDTAVGVVNHLAPWLPTLLAMSVNSPFDRGRDTGYGSWRAVQQSRFPGSGLPPYFPDYAGWQAEVAKLVDCGILVDGSMTFWQARPSPGLPTVELRVADTASTVDEALLQALLARALVRTALADLDRGREADPVPPQTGAAAVWSAARYGLRGPAVHPMTGRPVAAAERLTSMFAHVRDALEDTGDRHLVTGLLAGLGRRGTGADRQRQAAEGGPRAVVDLLLGQSVPPAT
jgi:glutamate---cysteine ligase / carboxylate-amine ligase